LDGCSVHGLGTAAITLHRIYGTRLTVEIGRHQTNVVFSVAAWHSAGPQFADWAPGAASTGCGVLWCGRMRDAFLWSLQKSQIPQNLQSRYWQTEANHALLWATIKTTKQEL
jgi:hypothetical protein